MNTKRDKFLTEAMGECWHYHKDKLSSFSRNCCKCGETFYGSGGTDFSTWAGFGKLWTWAIDQAWLEDFLNIMDVGEYIENHNSFTFDIQKEFINPDRLATAVYEYLKDK